MEDSARNKKTPRQAGAFKSATKASVPDYFAPAAAEAFFALWCLLTWCFRA